jgi:hypothetical protein
VAGYTPIFDSVFQGSLCGKWPDIGIWALMLAMQDKNGEIDAHPSYIAMVTGCPVEQVEQCIRRFCEPDPSSRTPDEDGRRLIPIPGRGFGWTVVNHRKYREKARKSSFDAARVADGRNAERMKTRADPRSPAQTRRDPPSDSDANTNTNSKKGAAAPFIEGLDPKAWEAWTEYRKAIGKAIKPASVNAAAKAMAALGAGQASAVQHSIANSYTGLFAPTVNGKPQPQAKREHPPTPEEIAAARRKAASDNDAQVRKLGLSGALKGMP